MLYIVLMSRMPSYIAYRWSRVLIAEKVCVRARSLIKIAYKCHLSYILRITKNSLRSPCKIFYVHNHIDIYMYSPRDL